jgi:hypothetical protein
LNRSTAPLLSGHPPRSSFSAKAPRRADSSEHSSDFSGSQGPPVRITPIIDPPRVSVTVSANSGRQRDPPPPNTRWVLPGQLVTIQGVKISSGLFYVGANRSSAQSRPENCLINSSLPIASAGSASTEGISYWPSYSGVTPPVRRAFLEWMASGKGDPSANIGLVFIYFYGLEYRLFKEGVNSDAGVLVAEVERLLKIYGANGSVQNYARAFLNVARRRCVDYTTKGSIVESHYYVPSTPLAEPVRELYRQLQPHRARASAKRSDYARRRRQLGLKAAAIGASAAAGNRLLGNRTLRFCEYGGFMRASVEQGAVRRWERAFQDIGRSATRLSRNHAYCQNASL